MKVAFFTDSFYPSVNGVVSSIINFSRGLAEEGHEVLIFAPKHPRGDVSDLHMGKGVKIVLLRSVDSRVYRDLRLVLPQLKIWKELKQFNPDIVHCHSPLSIGISGLVLGRRMGVPVLFTHGTKFDHEDVLKILGRFKVPFVEVVHKKGIPGLTRRYLGMHDGVIVSTQNTKDDLERMGVKEKISIVPIPVPVTQLRLSMELGLKKKQELDIEKALIFIGRLSPEKNLDLTFEVFARLVEKFEKLKLVLVGDGEWRDKLFLMANKLGVLDRIVWVGELTYDKLMSGGYYFLGDVFITLSRFETQGLSTVEAMACGLVPVVVEETASEEIVGSVGVVVRFDVDDIVDKVGRLLQESDLSARKNKVKKRADYFSIGECSKRLVRVYEEVINKKEGELELK